jgi:hypothetical protein
MKKFAQRILAAVALTAITSFAHSASLYCNGATVAQLSIHQPGVVYLRLSSMNTVVGICSLDNNWAPAGSLAGVTSAAACKAMYAALIVAKQNNAPIPQMLFDGDQVPASCNAFVAWQGVNVRYYDM